MGRFGSRSDSLILLDLGQILTQLIGSCGRFRSTTVSLFASPNLGYTLKLEAYGMDPMV